jgi:signal transduction histidine kinase
MEIGCAPETRDSREGLVAFVADNGGGFDVDHSEVSGKGVANMRARARAIHGQFDCTSGNDGTRITLWLPYIR